MSYILDAIRKSEHERQMREAPTLTALPNVSPQTPKRSAWFWPVIFLMCLNLAALVFWFSYNNNSALIVKGDTHTAVVIPTDNTITTETNKQPLTITKPSVAAEVAKKSNAAEKKSPSIADMLEPAPLISQPNPIKPRAIPKKTATTQPKRPRFAVTKKPATMARPIQPSVQPPVAQKQASTIPYLHTLSQDFQNRVPPVKMNIHMYSDQAKDSFAIINMTKYRSGEIISEDLKLEEITANGLVLSFEDQTFQLNHP